MARPDVLYEVQGAAATGDLAPAGDAESDLVMAADDAVFAAPEVDIGLWTFMANVPCAGRCRRSGRSS